MVTRFQETQLIESQTNPTISCYDTFQSLVAVGQFGSTLGKLKFANGVYIQIGTEHIFVSDSGNRRVQVFSEKGDYIFHITNPHFISPYGILVHKKDLFVTDWGCHVLFKISLESLLMIVKVGKEGSGADEFRSPRQIAISPIQELYVADCYNNRIQILDCDLQFLSSLRHRTMSSPVDLKFSTEKLLVLSRTDDPCVHVFTLSGEKSHSIITRGYNMQVSGAWFFCLDQQNNIIISDHSSHNIKVFSGKGELLYTIGETGKHPGEFYEPRGVETLGNKLVSVSYSLQIFSQN